MSTYFIEIECDGVVADEEWIKVFRLIKDGVVGSEQLKRLEFGTVDEDGLYSTDIDLF